MTKLIYPQGSWVAIVTPFDANLEMDLGVMRELVDFHAANHTSTLLIMGSTGEPTMLSLEERKRIIKEMAAYCKGKLHAFFGVTLGSTAMTIDLARYAEHPKIVGIGEYNGCLYNPDGIDIDALMAHRQETGYIQGFGHGCQERTLAELQFPHDAFGDVRRRHKVAADALGQ